MSVSVDQAYAIACRLLGEAQVQIELMADELERVTAERDQAGARIVELTSATEGGACEHPE